MNSSAPTVVVTRKRVAWFVAIGFAIAAVIAVSVLIALRQPGVITPALLALAIPCGVFWLLLSYITPRASATATAKEAGSLRWWEIVGVFGLIIAVYLLAISLPGVLIVPTAVVLMVAWLYFFTRPQVQRRLEQLRGPRRYEQPDHR